MREENVNCIIMKWIKLILNYSVQICYYLLIQTDLNSFISLVLSMIPRGFQSDKLHNFIICFRYMQQFDHLIANEVINSHVKNFYVQCSTF